MDGKIHRDIFEEQIVVTYYKNDSGETIPPYAAMIVSDYVFDADRLEMLATVRQCTEDDEKAQDYRIVLFNLHWPVKDEMVGRGTFSLPTMALVGGPDLTDPGGGDDAEPTADIAEPLRLDLVGPVRDSWKLWYGGVTHGIESIKIRGTERMAIVGPANGPGALIRFEEAIDAGSGNVPATGIVKLQVRNRSTGERQNAQANGADIELKVEHDGASMDGDNNLGQAKIASGRWVVDVKYC